MRGGFKADHLGFHFRAIEKGTKEMPLAWAVKNGTRVC